jgi:hypothetical protein
MNRFWKLAPWITRLILALPTALFAAIGIRYLTNVTAVGERGIAFTSGMGMTVGRVGFGAFPLACSLFLLGCLFFERRLLTGLAFVATLDSVVLAVRIISMFADYSIRENKGLVEAEVFLLVLSAAGLLFEFGRRRRAAALPVPEMQTTKY